MTLNADGTVTVWLAPETCAWLEDTSDRLGISQNDILAGVLSDHLPTTIEQMMDAKLDAILEARKNNQ